MNAVVKITSGKVRGSFADGVTAFKGVPFAAPPFGATRFRPPQPVEPWNGVRDALAWPDTGDDRSSPAVRGGQSRHPRRGLPEPQHLDLRHRGGRATGYGLDPGRAFEAAAGASVWYDGSRFARDGIVCVTVNYRPGADGSCGTCPG